MKKKELKSHMVNGELFTEEQKKLFWTERTIEKFKEYDKKRTEYVHRLEEDYQILRKRYEELEAELYGNSDGELSKGDRKGGTKLQSTTELCVVNTHCRSCRRNTWSTETIHQNFRLSSVIIRQQ